MQPNRQVRPTATSWVQMRSAGQQQQPASCQQLPSAFASGEPGNARCSLTSIGTTTSTTTATSTGGSGSSSLLGSSTTQSGSTTTATTTTSTSSGSNGSTASPLSEHLASSQLINPANLVNSPTPLQMIEQHDQQHRQQQLHQQQQQQQQQQLATDEEQREEENRKLRLQLQQQQHLKLRKNQLEQIVQLHTRYISGGSFATSGKCPHQQLNKQLTALQLKQLDELYERTHVTFNRKFLQNERMRMFVESGCCSQQDLRELFRQHVERIFKESKLFLPAKLNSSSMIRRSLSPKGEVIQSDSMAHQQQQQQQQQNVPPVNNLLANRDLIINSWLVKFEFIIREDNDGSIAAGSCSASQLGSIEPLAPLMTTSSGTGTGAGGSGVGMQSSGSCSGASSAVNATANSSQQQQQALNLSKEQLYQMFQNILNIKKFEHQLLYNALQLDSSDEQAAAVRRELDGRVSRIAELERNKKLMPKFVLKEMESLYLDESRMSVNKLMVNLDSLPVMKGSSNESRGVYGLQKFRRYNNSNLMINDKLSGRLAPSGMGKLKSKYPVSSFILSSVQQPLWSLTYNGLSSFGKIAAQASLTRDGLVESHPSEPQLTKLDVVLTFNIEVIVMEVRGLRQLAPTREIYCTMEIEGSDRLQTEHVQAKKPLWDTQGDFTTNHPLPVLKIKLYAVNPSMLSLEDKELGKLVLRPTVLSPKTPEWCTMVQASGGSSVLSGGGGGGGGGGASSNTISGGGANSINLPGGGNQNCDLNSEQNNDQELKIRVIVRMDRPQQLKHCGYLYGIGKSTWRKLKRRYHILIQVSQYTFVMCSYRDKKSKPTEMLQLDGYTVDYIEPPTDLIMEHCSEITSNELHSHHSHHHHHHQGSSGSSTLGLAGRLASAILKQQPVSGGGAGGAGSDAQSTGDGSNSNQDDREQPSAIQTAAALSDELHSKYYFNVVKEGDSVVFACDDEQECFGWVMALYRATGQAHKPTPLRNQYSGSTSHYIDAAFAYNTSASQPTKLVGNILTGSTGTSSSLSISSMLNGGKGGVKSSVDVADQRARKHGMDEFIAADPCKFQHNHLFKYLQNETLSYRLNDLYCSLGWFSPGQVLVLDEYCARYGVRTCFRHLAYLNSLLDFNQRGNFIDHTLLNYGYDFCASHVSGNSGLAHPIGSVNFDLRPDGVGTVTVEERDMFHQIKTKLLKMIERQISNFSYCFPFGKPDGALKAALSLLERVLMKEQQTGSMIQNEEVRNLIRKCLEQAALNNYTNLSGQANLLLPNPSASAGEYGGAPASSASPLPGIESGEHQTNDYSVARRQAQMRTSSNLSSSSVGSYSSNISSSTGNAHSLSSHNDSIRRRGQLASGEHQQQQQQQQQQHQQQQQCLTMAMIINNEHIKPRDKLRYLIRLAELCCEQVEENNEYFGDAFAWHSDLMMDHFELFWSLFSVDMDKILNELNAAAAVAAANNHNNNQQQQQPSSISSNQNNSDILNAGNREIFTLFQVLNNHRRKDTNLECRKFKAYLCDTFKPKLLRYIDIMESTLTRMLFKAFEKDGQVNCTLINEQLFIKLDGLQKFVLIQLRWPDDHLAEQLHQRLKLIAYELCDSSVQRTLQAFQQLERKSNKWTATSTASYSAPVEMIQMINLVLETRNRSLKLCTFNSFDQMSYHYKIDKLIENALGEMQPGLMSKMIYALESTLTKLARYDEGNLLAPILSLTYKQGMSSSGRDIGKQYVTFVSNCCDQLRHKINDELWIVNLLEEWYSTQMNIICSWLGERIDRSLHDVQLVALANIMPKIYADMSLQGVSEDKLNLKTYQTVMSRLKMEEAAATASGGCQLEQPPSTSIFNTSILSSRTSSGVASATSSNPGGVCGSSALANSSAVPPSANIMASSGVGGGVGGKQQSRSAVDSPTLLASRRFQPLNAAPSFGNNDGSSGGQAESGQQESDNNIADRAFQGATRMFKGFWAS